MRVCPARRQPALGDARPRFCSIRKRTGPVRIRLTMMIGASALRLVRYISPALAYVSVSTGGVRLVLNSK